LRTSRHNNTFKLLKEQLGIHNGGRWPIVSMDLGNKTIKDFKTQIKIELTTPQKHTTLQALEDIQEGLQNDKAKAQHPTIKPTDLLPKHKRPPHYKPNIIRAIGTHLYWPRIASFAKAKSGENTRSPPPPRGACW
jgi:hypothetical protein